MDNEFEKLQTLMPILAINTMAAKDHVPEVERKIRLIKERRRGILNSFTPIRVPAGMKNSTSNTTINKHHHHGGAVCRSYSEVLLDTPNPTRVTSSKGVGQGRVHWV